jgi:hypothetical protein
LCSVHDQTSCKVEFVKKWAYIKVILKHNSRKWKYPNYEK